MSYIFRVLEFIRKGGIAERGSGYDQLTGFLNLYGFLFALGGIIIFLGYTLAGVDNSGVQISLFVSISYTLPVILNHLGYRKIVRFYFAGIIPIWIGGVTLLTGVEFGQSIAIGANIVLVGYLYSRVPRWKIFFMAHNIFLFIFPTLYIFYNGSLLDWGIKDVPGDEVGVFLICLVWISVIASAYKRRSRQKKKIREKEIRKRKKEVEELIYLTSHDMKAPVRNILGLLAVMKENVEQENWANMQVMTKHLESSAESLNALIHDVLNVSRFSTADPSTYTEVDLSQELEKAIFNNKAEIESRNAEVVFDKLPIFDCNAGDFLLIFQNLVQNGLKYNESEHPRIEIRLESSSDTHTISVQDNGIGIPEKHYEEVFKLFKRVHTGGKYKGTGIGLGIVKKIVDKYNGEISVTSKEGEYSRFTIQLPHRGEADVKQLLVQPFRELLVGNKYPPLEAKGGYEMSG